MILEQLKGVSGYTRLVSALLERNGSTILPGIDVEKYLLLIHL
jgi:hypothetical protein